MFLVLFIVKTIKLNKIVNDNDLKPKNKINHIYLNNKITYQRSNVYL